MAGIYTNTVPVRSSNLKAVGWAHVDGEDILEVEFLNGSLYKYTGVIYWHYKRLLRAGSKGGYLHREIKRQIWRYPYKMLRTSRGRVLVPLPGVEEPVIEEPVIEDPVIVEPVIVETPEPEPEPEDPWTSGSPEGWAEE